MIRRSGYILTFIILVCAGVYSGLWYYYAYNVHKAATDYIENLRANDNHIVVKTLSVNGFPFKIAVNFEGRIASNGFVIEIPALEVNSLLMPGRNISILFDRGVKIIDPYDPALWSADYLLLEGIIPENMPENLTREDMRTWFENNGSILINNLHLRKQQLEVKGNGLVSLDQNLQPKGRFQAVITGHMEFLQWLSVNGYIKTKEALLSATVLSGLTRTNGSGGTPFMPVDLVVENQVLYAGPLRVIALPTVVWPWKELKTIPLDQLQ